MEDNPIQNKLSYKIKIPIIILTLITVCAMGALFIKVAYSISASESQSETYQYLLKVGGKLKNEGLYEQAIDQYIQYLEKTKTNTSARAIVAHTVGELYMELSNCQEALVWLFQAEEAEKTHHRTDELKKRIDVCLTKIRSPKPSNLNAK